MLIPTFDLRISAVLFIYNVIARNYVTDKKKRSWLMSVPVTLIMSAVGVYEFVRPIDTTSTALSVFTTELLKDYMIVELFSEVLFNFKRINVLETVVHHIFYMYIFDYMIEHEHTGFVRPFFILELPTFIRSMGKLYPEYNSGSLFGVFFILFRIIWPFIIVLNVTLPSQYYIPFTAIQAMHIYWLYGWIKKSLLTPPDVHSLEHSPASQEPVH